MKSSNSKNVLIVILIALVMTMSLVGGYKVITMLSPAVKSQFDVYTDPVVDQINEELEERKEQKAQKEQEKLDARFAYTGTTNKEYTGPTIHSIEGYFFNSDGKRIDDYRDDNKYSLRMTKNKDGSEAIFTVDRTLMYMDADLNITEITDHVNLAGMCFDGGRFFYLKDSGVDDTLYIYDVAQQESIIIAKGDFRSVCISPNGKTVVYSERSNLDQFHIASLEHEIEDKVYNAKDQFSLISVSNDAQTVFYYGRNDDKYYCMDNGKTVSFGKKTYNEDYLDRECKQMVFEDKKGKFWYYRAGDKKASCMVKDKKARMHLNNVNIMELDVYMNDYILDVDSFCDAMMFVVDYKCYALYGDTPELVDMTPGIEKPYYFSTCVTAEGPTCVYRDDGKVYKAVYDGNVITRTEIYECGGASFEMECSPDLRRIWIRDKKEYYCISDFGTPVLVYELGDGTITTYEMKYDALDDVCYIVIDNKLHCLGNAPDEEEIVMENVKRFGYVLSDIEIPCISDGYNNEFVIIKKEAVAK